MLQSLVNVRKKEKHVKHDILRRIQRNGRAFQSVWDKSMLWSKQLIEIANSDFLISSDEGRDDEERFLAIIFIIRSGYNRFGGLIKDLLRNNIRGIDKYPTTVTKGFGLLQGYKTKGLISNKNSCAPGGGSEGNSNNGGGNQHNGTPRVSFSQISENNIIVPETDGSTLDKQSLRYFNYQKRKYLSNSCLISRGQQTKCSFMTDRSCLSLSKQDSAENVKQMIPKSWLLLDKCTTRSVSNNKNMVNNITNYKCDDCLKLYTNGVTTICKQMAKLRLLPLNVHFNEASIATIISFSDVCDIHGIRVIFDLNIGIHFDVILPLAKLSVSNVLTQNCFIFT